MKQMTLAVTLALSACAVDDVDSVAIPSDEASDEAANSADVEPFFSGLGTFTWRRSDNLPTSANRTDTVSSANWTCFLSGVAGNLQSMYGAPQGTGELNTVAVAQTYVGGSPYYNWQLEATPGSSYNKLRADSVCVNSVVGEGSRTTWAGGPAKVISSATGMYANRACFLTAVRNTEPYYQSGTFNSDDDEVRVWKANGYWYIGGSGDANGTAYCIDVNEDYGEASIGSSTAAIMYDHGGVRCMLSGLKGKFRTDDFYSGGWLTYDGGLRQWKLTASAGKWATARCVE